MDGKDQKSDMSSGDNTGKAGKTGQSPPGKSAKAEKVLPKSSSSKKEEDRIITIDLTDPEDLMRKMEMIDFTEEETDELMKQAIEVNKMLKKELQKHEFDALRKSFSRAVTISATTGERTSGLMVLPPVEKDGKTNLASLNFSKRSSKSTPASASDSRTSLARRRSSGGESTKASAKPKKSAAPKAEWSDRWN